MNTDKIKKHNGLKNSISIALMITIMLSIMSCAQQVPFLVSSVVPSAEGSVKVKQDKNNNYNIDLSVIRLVDPSRLSPSKAGYIVWMYTEQNGVQNIGQLASSSNMMSKTLKGSLSTVTPYKPTGFFITGEDNLTTDFPGTIVLNSQTFSMR